MKQRLITIITGIVIILFLFSFYKISKKNIAEITRLESIAQNDISMDNAKDNYKEYCAGCHGDQLEAFADRRWIHGNKPEDLKKAITYGYPDGGMSAYEETFSEQEIDGLVAYILDGIKNVERYNFDNNIKPGEIIKSEVIDFKLEVVMDNMDSPWGMAFLPNGEMLVTEKSGILYKRNKDGSRIEINGLPEINSRGQGGLMDIELHPDFDRNNILYLSFSKPKNIDGRELYTTAILKARLNNNSLVDQQIIFEALPYFPTNHHYGNRMVFDENGYMFFSVGERGRRDTNPQYLNNHGGKIHRIKDDGSIPEDNPFVDEPGAMGSIYSYGHRNPQGLIIDKKTGTIWEHEHGPKGGDELNIIEKGKNYGWPVISYGINYNGTPFTDITEKEGMEQPITYWVPSIAPCGMTQVTGNKYKGWEGDLLIGSLRFKYLNRCKIEGNKVVKQEMLLKNIGRLRDVEMGDDGYIYVSVERPGIIYRIVPI